MNPNLSSALAAGALVAAALLGVAAIASAPAYADDITVEHEPFVSTRTRASVNADLRTPYPGGNPWSGLYNMFQAPSTATSAQVQGEYIANREKVAAFCGEDSGSAYITTGLARSPGRAMGAAAR